MRFTPTRTRSVAAPISSNLLIESEPISKAIALYWMPKLRAVVGGWYLEGGLMLNVAHALDTLLANNVWSTCDE